MFSSSLVLGDLDYIAPSQACIKPVTLPPTASSAEVYRHVAGEAPPAHLEPVRITLQDCLACSGCVTSAETMLVTSQSRSEVEALLSRRRPESGNDSSGNLRFGVSISDASASSIAAHMGWSMETAMRTVCRFVKNVLRADVVLDLRWAEQLSSQLVFVDYAQRVLTQPQRLPLLVSACPGWVCYCEKQYPELLPLLSPVLSAQGIAGSVLKSFAAGTSSTSVYHLSIQPCFDRKLEAARDSLPSTSCTSVSEDTDVTESRLTDCVLSTVELMEWMRETNMLEAVGDDENLPDTWSLRCVNHRRDQTAAIAVPDTIAPAAGATIPSTLGLGSPTMSPPTAEMRGSGGYHLDVLELLARRMTTGTLDAPFDPDVHVSYECKRNPNHRFVRTPFDAQLAAALPPSTPHLFSTAYGFQQIQNIVRGLRKGALGGSAAVGSKTVARTAGSASHAYSFLEIMACPSGCLNGGAQLRAEAHVPHEERLQAVTQVYTASLSRPIQQPASPLAVVVGISSDREVDALREHVHLSVHRCFEEVASLLDRVSLPQPKGAGVPIDGASLLPRWSTTVFHDRKKEMEAILNSNPLHSLKW